VNVEIVLDQHDGRFVREGTALSSAASLASAEALARFVESFLCLV
jgi:hypothetical protein